MKQIAKQILGLIDLTSLNDKDTKQVITNLCSRANNQFGNVAAICIFSEFIAEAKLVLNKLDSKVKIATVVNFPAGHSDIELTGYESKLALARGANEIDLVLPYHQLKQGNTKICAEMVRQIKSICKDKTLKVILETGELSRQEIKLASEISIYNGADFIKTSTGKVSVNATIDAAEIMLNVIKESGKKCGFKASGGIKTVAQALTYINLAENIFDESWITPCNFRFGASGLIGDVISMLNNGQEFVNKPSDNY
jgi:deoxyribose-phosphate aldolase